MIRRRPRLSGNAASLVHRIIGLPLAPLLHVKRGGGRRHT